MAASCCQSVKAIGSMQAWVASVESNAAMWVGPAQAQWRGSIQSLSMAVWIVRGRRVRYASMYEGGCGSGAREGSSAWVAAQVRFSGVAFADAMQYYSKQPWQ
ncbi:hypothetical protein BM1_02494 [Bipolaris maydis]|nr:hypothetical protein BM1_02494 [Bipolaris maydis]